MRRYGPTFGAIVLSLLLMGGFVIVYTGYSQQQSDKRWCALFLALDPPGAPPTTGRGQIIQQLIRKLKADFHCEAVAL